MRLDIAYFLLAVLIAALLAVVWLTRRYVRYQRRAMRGHYDKPVWRPFWMR